MTQPVWLKRREIANDVTRARETNDEKRRDESKHTSCNVSRALRDALSSVRAGVQKPPRVTLVIFIGEFCNTRRARLLHRV